MITHEELKRRCNENPQCYCPSPGQMSAIISHIPEWLRRAFSKDQNQRKDRKC